MQKKIVLVLITILITLIIIWIDSRRNNNNISIVFCNVGQGDGIYIDLPNNIDVVIDGGPDNKILECLGKYMPFWDRNIEIVILSHPQADHLNGLIEVVKRYKVNYFAASPVGNSTEGYTKLVNAIEKTGTTIQNIYTDDVIKIGSVNLNVLWPSRKFIADNTNATGNSNILGATTSDPDLNDFSVVLELEYGNFEAVFTGDADEDIQDEILNANKDIKSVEVFKIPHHGSRFGLLDEYIDKFEPVFAVISVGKNQWGHPTKELLSRLDSRSIPVLRTDINGNIVVKSNGQQYWIESDNK